MLHKQACADIQRAARENVGVIVDLIRGAIQRPDLRGTGFAQGRLAELTEDQPRFFPRQRGFRLADDLFKQLQGGVMDL
jgi:hypothetical protein